MTPVVLAGVLELHAVQDLVGHDVDAEEEGPEGEERLEAREPWLVSPGIFFLAEYRSLNTCSFFDASKTLEKI